MMFVWTLCIGTLASGNYGVCFPFSAFRILYLILSQSSVTCTVTFPEFPLRHNYFTSVYLSIISDWEMIILVILSAFIIHTQESYSSKKMTYIPGRHSLVHRPRVKTTSLFLQCSFHLIHFLVFNGVNIVCFLVMWRSWPWFSCSFCCQVAWWMCGYFSVLPFTSRSVFVRQALPKASHHSFDA